VVLIGIFSRTFWSTVAAAIPTELSWLNPFESGVLFERVTEIVKFIVFEGSAMFTATFNFIAAALVVAFVVWLTLSATKRRAFIGMAASLLAVAAAPPSTDQAYRLPNREHGPATVTADEPINDTPLALSQSV